MVGRRKRKSDTAEPGKTWPGSTTEKRRLRQRKLNVPLDTDSESDNAAGSKMCMLSEDDSSSSSDDTKQTNLNSKSSKSLETQSALNSLDIEVKKDNTIVEPSEYYDFSSIIKSQQELKNIEQKLNIFKDDNNENKKTFLNDVECSDSENISEILKLCEKNTKTSQSDYFTRNENKESEVSSELPSQVEIIIKQSDQPTKNCRKQQQLEAYVKKAFNNERRSLQVVIHKVNLLCFLAYGFYCNSVANSEEILALNLSILPSDKFYPPEVVTSSYVLQLLNWFHKNMQVNVDKLIEKKFSLKEIIIKLFPSKETNSNKNLVIIFVSLTRVLGMKSRLLFSLQPVPLRPAAAQLMKTNSKNNEKDCSTEESSGDSDFVEVSESSSAKSMSKTSLGSTSSKQNSKQTNKKKCVIENGKKTQTKSRGKNVETAKNTNTSKSSKKTKLDRRVLSSDEESSSHSSNKKQVNGVDVWAEVYIEAENKWISVDVVRNDIDCVTKISSGCTKPITYVISWDNNDCIKDLTRRYAPQWLTSTQKLRVDPQWWQKSIEPWAPRNTKQERAENKELDRLVEECPLPTSISEYRGHPYFVLLRHLKKFEAIYPPDAKPLGYCKKEAVYSRLCVSELHARETWMRQGKVVRLKEEPYKIVKARPKYDKMSGNVVRDLPLNLYGYWQVEDYIPPVAIDGQVPRNEYGNVELYKPSMLPGGTVHLQIPGVMKIAKRLNVDCAPAVVGWDFHSGGSHPVFDGVVVCQEFQDTILDAWNKEIDESSKRSKEKISKRAKANWKKLIRLIIVKKRLDKKYNFSKKM